MFEMKITGGAENDASLHADISLTGGRNSDLPFTVVLQEY
jgi:hypothetical protein